MSLHTSSSSGARRTSSDERFWQEPLPGAGFFEVLLPATLADAVEGSKRIEHVIGALQVRPPAFDRYNPIFQARILTFSIVAAILATGIVAALTAAAVAAAPVGVAAGGAIAGGAAAGGGGGAVVIPLAAGTAQEVAKAAILLLIPGALLASSSEAEAAQSILAAIPHEMLAVVEIPTLADARFQRTLNGRVFRRIALLRTQ